MAFDRREMVKAGGAFGALTLFSGGAFGKTNLKEDYREVILDYFKKLPSWDTFSPPVPDGNVRTNTPPSAPVINGALSCTRTEYSLSKNSDKLVMFEPDRDVLWPGALIQGRGYSDGLGSLRELPIKKRAPLRVGLALLADKNYSVVQSPSATSVNDAISKLIAQAVQQKINLGSSVSYTSTASYSAEQAMLSVGISAKYAGASLSASHQSTSSTQKSSATTYFVQNMFTIFVELSLTPADLFTSDFGPKDLIEQENLGRIGVGNIPVMLSSISFGRILYVTTTAEATAEAIQTAVAASYSAGGSGGGAQLNDAQKKVLQNAQISVTALGGDANGAIALIKTGKTADYFNTDVTAQSVRPISFSFRNLSDLSLAAIRDSTKYTITECSAAQPTKDILDRTNAIDVNLAELVRYVRSAVSNWADHRRRGELMGVASRLQNTVLTSLRSLQVATLPDGDRAWLTSFWIKRFLSDLELELKKCEIEIPANHSDPGTTNVWLTDQAWFKSIQTVANGLLATLSKA